jgi:NADH:ubiquinone oxidoreductase subunit 2 (subunit N)
VSLVPFLAISFGAAAAALIVRGYRRLSLAIGLFGLVVATIAALAIVPGDRLAVGPGRLETTEFGRLFLALGCSTGLVITIVGLATAWQRNLPSALLGGFGALGLALSIGDPIIALVAILAGALVGSLVTLTRPVTARNVQVASREFRAIAVAGALALVGMAWIARPLGTLAEEPTVFGLAYLAVAMAAAIRFGEIPFHRWAARLADSAPEVALPLLLAWAPAGFAVVALAWMDRSIAPLLLPLSVERSVVLAVGVLSIVLGAIAAWLQDDLEHVVGYSIVQDAGFVMLGLAVLDPAAWQPTRTWILVFVVVKTAFAAWAVAVRTRFGTRRIPELDGWARRSPVLAVSLALIVLATIGLPGLVSWDVRARLVDLSVTSEPIRLVVILGGLASLAYYGRIALAGARSPSALVSLGGSERPRWPTPAETDGGAEVAPAAAGTPTTVLRVARLEARARIGWMANRAPIASAGVIVLALTALAVAGGGLGTAAAAAAPAPEPVAPTEIFVPGQTEPPSQGPIESGLPSAGPSAEPTGGPSAEPSPGSSRAPASEAPTTSPPSAAPSPSPGPGASPTQVGSSTPAPTVSP